MDILVLDTIHGGDTLGKAFSARGDRVDCVDVYRNGSAVDVPIALTRTYDLIVAPVHLDPDHPLLRLSPAPVITHHEAVRRLLGDHLPRPMIEITGAQGKTTTAHALAFLMTGPGILHTSTGTYLFPEKRLISRSGITPASVLAAADLAHSIHGWLVAEESLGVSGAGDLSIITSSGDYPIAAGKKSALAAKTASALNARRVLLAENIPELSMGQSIHIEDVAACDCEECRTTLPDASGRFSNPLLAVPGYQTPLMLAAAAAMILGIDPAPLSSFCALPGRMSVSRENGLLIVDNANSGTNAATTISAARYARQLSGEEEITLVIGQVAGDGAVCEGFSSDGMRQAIREIHPSRIVWVGISPLPETRECNGQSHPVVARSDTLEEASAMARRVTNHGSVVLAVKTWR